MPNYGVGRCREIFLGNLMSKLKVEEVNRVSQRVVIMKHVPQSAFLSDQKVFFCVSVVCVKNSSVGHV